MTSGSCENVDSDPSSLGWGLILHISSLSANLKHLARSLSYNIKANPMTHKTRTRKAVSEIQTNKQEPMQGFAGHLA